MQSQDTTLVASADSVINQTDTIADVSKKPAKSSSALDAKVEYQSTDSIRFDLRNQRVFMYGDANIDYEKINLKAEFVRINFKSDLLYAEGKADST